MTIADSSKDEILRKWSVLFILVCSPLSLSLIPSRSNLSFRRNQDFYISSLVQSECRSSFVLQYRWSIDNGSSSISLESPFLLHSSDLFIRSQTLPLGIYRIELTVTRNNLTSATKSTFVRITPSGIRANLVLFGSSMINVGDEQDLQLDPGNHSIDEDGKQFNASVEFFFVSDCNARFFSSLRIGITNISIESLRRWILRLYFNLWMTLFIPIVRQVASKVDPSNISVMFISSSIEGVRWRSNGSEWFSSLRFVHLSTFVVSNLTYQWMLRMENKRNHSLQGTGYLLVHVERNVSSIYWIG